MLRNGILVLIVLGIFFGAVLFVGMYDQWQEAQIEKEKLDRESHERIEKEKIKAERERVEAERERVEAERERVEAETLEAQKVEAERLESLKTPEQKEAERLETEKLKMENLEAERLEAERLNQERIDRNNQDRRDGLETNNFNTPKLNQEKTKTCNDFKEALNQIYQSVGRYNQICESVQYGSYDDFILFSKEMQLTEDAAYSLDSTPKKINEQIWKIIDTAKSECPQLRTEANDRQLQFSLMGLCFESVYEEFGEFPAMWFGMSPDYFEYNPEYTTNNDQCELFCDSYGYEPQWAKSMGVYQAASKCTTILNNWENSDPDDQSWCTELAGYLVTG